MNQNQANLFTPIGTRAIGLAWSNLIKALEIGEPKLIERSMRILAASPGKSEISQKLKGWLLEVDQAIELASSGASYSTAETQSKNIRMQELKLEKYMDVYDKLIELLNEKKLLDFQIVAPISSEVPHIGRSTT